MLFEKRKLYQNLVKVLIISILGSNSLVVFATDMSGSSEFNEPENISTNDLLSSSSILGNEDTMPLETTEISSESTFSEENLIPEASSTEEINNTDMIEEVISTEEVPYDPYFPLEPNEDDVRGDKVRPGEIAIPDELNVIQRRRSSMNQEIINNVTEGIFKRATIKQDWRTYSMFPYQTLNGSTQNKPHGIVIHETANPNSTIENEIAYMDRNWRNAFVHAFVDQSKIIEIHDPSYGAWGAGREANKYFMHIELVEHPNDRTAFMKSVLNDAYYAATKLYQFGLTPSRPSKKKGDISGTIWSHHEVSAYLGGTDHSDPTGYFSKFGYSMEQFYELIQYEYKLLNKTPPVITSAKVIDVDHVNETFSVVVEAESNTKIKSIEIPVWTKSDQSDIKWYEAILLSGNKYKATVKSSDFNYSRGSYKIHCYAYDIAGMQSLVGLENVTFSGILPTISNPKIELIDSLLGTTDISVTVTSKYGIKKVEVPVWTKSDQSDIKWYEAKLKSNGKYGVTISAKDFNFNRGPYNIHIYGTSNRGVVNFVGMPHVNFEFPEITGKLETKNINGEFKKYKIALDISNSEYVEKVEIPVWGTIDGQNDLQWYEAKYNSVNKSWDTEVNITEHNELGKYLAHAYIYLKNGEKRLLADTYFEVPLPKVTTSLVTKNYKDGKVTLDINVDSKIKVSNIEVPVWKNNNQQDIYWYKAQQLEDSRYQVEIDYKNHQFNTGNFNAHIYIYLENKLRLIEGGPSINLERPELAPSVQFKKINQTEYLIEVDTKGNQEVTKVELPTWSESMGQDDLNWYQAKYNSNTGKWETKINIKNHKDTGHYQTHLYIKRLDNKKELFDTSGFMVDSVSSEVDFQKSSHSGITGILIKLDSKKDILNVEVPVWSKSDMSDIKWYRATRVDDRNEFKVNVDYSFHQFNTGKYNAHVYITEKNGMRTINSLEPFSLTRPKLKPIINVNNPDGRQEKYIFTVDLNNHPEVAHLKMPTWGGENGQNDLKWYNADQNKITGKWEAIVDIKNHKEIGQYFTHLYVYYQDGTYELFDTSSFFINSTRIDYTIDNTELHNGRSKISLQLKTNFNIISVEVPAWSKSNQEDIKWYKAEKNVSSYDVIIDYKNHQNNIGMYNAHVYVYTSSGIKELFGLPSINLSNPIVSDTTSNGKYLREIITEAKEIANKNNLYPSVMIAQSVLESGYGTSKLAKEANNYFGMKYKVGQDSGNYDVYYIESKEFDSAMNQWITIESPFRKYANRRNSFEDNALKLTKGVSWDSMYYSGTWRGNAQNYKEATAALQGKYATDPNYSKKLNNIIEKWHLFQYD